MRILVADDDRVSRYLLEATLRGWGFEAVGVGDGLAAWETLQQEAAPRLAILDWMMPGLSGPDICARVRQQAGTTPPYLILLTARDTKSDRVAGLENGADDYLAKPFDPAELRARLQAGMRIIDLQQTLADRIAELELALSRVKQLQGLLPMCAWCRKVRDDHNYWQQLDSYLAQHVDARFTHGICPDCLSQARNGLARGGAKS